jgi:hypothetical protein
LDLSNSGVALSGTGTFTQGNGSTLNYSGSSISVTNFNANTATNTVHYNAAAAQTVRPVTYHNLSLSGSGSKSMNAITINGNISIANSAKAALTLTSTAQQTLTLDGSGTGDGTWGSTSSPAVYQNNNYFENTGILVVGNNTCTSPDVSNLTASATDVCTGTGSVVTVSSNSLANGLYSIEYSLSGSNPGGPFTTTLNFSEGTGTFTTDALNTAGNDNVVTITSVAVLSLGCIETVNVSTPAFNTNPIPSITIDDATEEVCFSPFDQSASLGYSDPDNSPTLYSITFDAAALAAGFVNVVDATLDPTPILVNIPAGTVAGVYNASISVSTDFCSSSSPIPFTITIHPATPIFDTQPDANEEVCAGVPVDYSLVTEVGDNTFLWTFPGLTESVDYNILVGGTTDDDFIQVEWLTAGSKTLSVNYTTLEGCEAVVPTVSNAVNVTVALDLSGMSVSAEEICVGNGTEVTFIATGLPAGTYPITYSVAGANNPLPISTSIVVAPDDLGTFTTIVLDTAGNNTITLETITAGGCPAYPVNVVSPTFVTNPLPQTFDVTSVGPSTYCAGDEGVEITLSGSESGINYQLLLNGNPVGGPIAGTGDPFSFGLHKTAGTYTVTAANGTTSCTQMMTGSVAVVINTVTAGTFTNRSITCSGGSTVLEASTQPTTTPGATITYRWLYSENNVNYVIIKQPEFSVTPTSAIFVTFPLNTGTYYFKRTVISTLNGVICEATSTPITVTVGSGLPPIRTTDDADNWASTASWTTGAIPGTNDGNIGCPVSVNHELVLNQNFTVSQGVFAINKNVSSDAASRDLRIDKSPNNFRFDQAIIDVRAGSTVKISGTAFVRTSTLVIRKGGTLIIGPEALEDCMCWKQTIDPKNDEPYDPAECEAAVADLASLGIGDQYAERLTIEKSGRVIVEEGGTLIVYGSINMSDPQGGLVANGFIYTSGNFSTTAGDTQVTQDQPGTGDLYTCGEMTTQGSSTVFGTPNDCIEGSEYWQEPDGGCIASALSCTFSASINPAGIIGYCNGLELLGITTLVDALIVEFKWEVSEGTVGSFGPVYTSGLKDENPLEPEPVLEGNPDTFYRLKIKDNSGESGCVRYSPPVLIRPGLNTWIGNKNGFNEDNSLSDRPFDWHDELNWCLNVPTETSDIILNSATPIIYGPIPAYVRDLTLNAGVLLTLKTGSYDDEPEFFINGNLFNYGSIEATEGAVIFAGSNTDSFIETDVFSPAPFNFNTITFNKPVLLSSGVNLNIRGDLNDNSGATMDLTTTRIQLIGSKVGVTQNVNINDNVLSNLTINKAGGDVAFTSMAYLGGIPNLGGLLTIESATVVRADGKLTVRSTDVDYNSDGSIGPIPSDASVIGTVHVQRNMDPATYALFRYIATPVASNSKPPQVNKLYYYDNGWKGTNTMTNGVGYTALNYNQSTIIITMSNTIGSGPKSWNLNAGWNLLGNPYPSAIQWAQSAGDTRWTLNNVSSLIAITDNSFDGYPGYFRYYDFNDPALSNPTYVDEEGEKEWGSGVIKAGVIAMGQSFWVYAGSDASLSVTESAKVAPGIGLDGEFYRKRKQTASEILRVKVTNGTEGDEAILRINENATDDFDSNLDYPKFWNMGMNVYLQDIADESMLMLALPELADNVRIPLGIQFTEAGEYSISFGDASSFSYSSKLYLIDKYENVAHPITSSQAYTFSIKDITKPLNDRFYLSMNTETNWSIDNSIKIYPNPVKEVLHVQLHGVQEQARAELIDMNGKIMLQGEFTSEADIEMVNFPAGMYILRLQTSKGVVTRKIVKHD